MKNTLFALLSAALVLVVPGCAADAEDGDEAPVVEIEDGLSQNQMTNRPPTKYVPRVTRYDILAGGGTCGSNYCSINGTNYQCSGGGTCTYLGRDN